MFKIIKNIFIVLLVLSFGFVSAQWVPDDLVIEISKTSFDVNEPVDVTVKMVKDNWEVVKDYEGDIRFEIVELFNEWEDHTLPGGWMYTFYPEDQWVKLFSKWLMVKVPSWEKWFTLQVSDLFDPTISDKKTIFVGDLADSQKSDVSIISPSAWAVVSSEVVDIVAKATDLPNSTYQIYVNWVVKSQSVSTEKWDIIGYASGLNAGQNTIQIKIVDINQKVIWESPIVSFTYQSSSDGVFDSIEVLPSTNIKQWDKVTINVKTSDQVSSTEVLLSNWASYPMDRLTAGSFSKQVLIDKAGRVEISLSLITAGNTKKYDNVASLEVQEKIWIWDVKFVVDPVDKKKVTVSWNSFWAIAKYKVDYWQSETTLSESLTVDSKEVVFDNLDPEKVYYMRISPLDSLWLLVGDTSSVLKIEPTHSGADKPTCIVKWIKVFTWKVWDKYYLKWDAVENAEKYKIYRSDWQVTDVSKMDKLWETTENRFEYPFNNNTKTYLYAYYAVEAVCSDWNSVIVDEVKKVNVGPLDNFLVIVVIWLFVYAIYKLGTIVPQN